MQIVGFMSINHCGSCANCCKGTLVKVNKEDIARWKKEQQYDILLCITEWPGGTLALIHKNEKKLDECIFLTKKGCSIYETRPQVCRDFPKGPNQVNEFNCKLDWKTHKLNE